MNEIDSAEHARRLMRDRYIKDRLGRRRWVQAAETVVIIVVVGMILWGMIS